VVQLAVLAPLVTQDCLALQDFKDPRDPLVRLVLPETAVIPDYRETSECQVGLVHLVQRVIRVDLEQLERPERVVRQASQD